MNTYTLSKIKKVLTLLINDVIEYDLESKFYKNQKKELTEEELINKKSLEIINSIKDIENYSCFELYVIISKYYNCEDLIDLELFHSILFDEVPHG